MTFGTRLAVPYAALRHEVFTVPAKTTVLTKPRILAMIVRPPIRSAARPTPAAALLPAAETDVGAVWPGAGSALASPPAAGSPAGLAMPAEPASAGPPRDVTVAATSRPARRHSRFRCPARSDLSAWRRARPTQRAVPASQREPMAQRRPGQGDGPACPASSARGSARLPS